MNRDGQNGMFIYAIRNKTLDSLEYRLASLLMRHRDEPEKAEGKRARLELITLKLSY